MNAPIELVRTILVPALIGAAWAGLCVVLKWPLNGLAGVVLGAMVGGSLLLLDRNDAPVAGVVVAAVVTGLLLSLGGMRQASEARQAARATIDAEESFLLVIAEQILWERAGLVPEQANQQSWSTQSKSDVGTTVPAFAALDEVPPALLADSRHRWENLTNEEKTRIRAERVRFVEDSLGSDLEHWETLATAKGWIATCLLATITALLLAASPLISARYFNRRGG